MGPVSGIEKKVEYYDDGQYHHDYTAKPDYHFEYGVADPHSKVHQSRQETRHGDTVEGEYRCCAFKSNKLINSHVQSIDFHNNFSISKMLTLLSL